MTIVIEKDYYGEIIDIYGPFPSEAAAEQWIKDMGFLGYRVEIMQLTSPRSKRR